MHNIEQQIEVEEAKASVQSEICKQKGIYEEMFKYAAEAYKWAIFGYNKRGNARFLTCVPAYIERIEEAALNTSIENIASFALLLFGNRSIGQPDYEKMAKYLKKAAVEGRYLNYILNYLDLVEREKVINKHYYELCQFYEDLKDYELKENKVKEATKFFRSAVKYCRKGANLNQPDSMFKYAKLIKEGKVKDDKKLIKDLFEKGCNMNHPPLMFEYGKILEKTKLRSNVTRAIKLYEKASSYNYPDAMFRYAQVLEENCMLKTDRLK